MRVVDLTQGRMYRHVRKHTGCRAYLRVPVVPSWFLACWRHRPRLCNHNTHSWGRAGEGP